MDTQVVCENISPPALGLHASPDASSASAQPQSSEMELDQGTTSSPSFGSEAMVSAAGAGQGVRILWPRISVTVSRCLQPCHCTCVFFFSGDLFECSHLTGFRFMLPSGRFHGQR